MNRQQRRAAAKSKSKGSPRPEDRKVPENSTAAKPGLVLRLFAKIVLTPWVLNRVKHADVERLLAGVAVQTGRPEIAESLLNRIALRSERRR